MMKTFFVGLDAQMRELMRNINSYLSIQEDGLSSNFEGSTEFFGCLNRLMAVKLFAVCVFRCCCTILVTAARDSS